MTDSLNAAQCRAARGLLGWTQADAARAVGMSAVAVRAFERGGAMRPANLNKLREAFEAAGIEFISGTRTKGPGVRRAQPLD